MYRGPTGKKADPLHYEPTKDVGPPVGMTKQREREKRAGLKPGDYMEQSGTIPTRAECGEQFRSSIRDAKNALHSGRARSSGGRECAKTRSFHRRCGAC